MDRHALLIPLRAHSRLATLNPTAASCRQMADPDAYVDSQEYAVDPRKDRN